MHVSLVRNAGRSDSEQLQAAPRSPLEPATPFLHIGETDCVADDTVLIGPVSTFKFPASREFAGNF